MANPRQRRKAKSSAHKPISHSKRAKRLQKKMPAIRGPKVLQDAWDSSKTVCQNYVALGLQHDLDPISSGGSEVHVSRTVDSNHARRSHSDTSPCAIDDNFSVSEGCTVMPALPKGFGRIVRDSVGGVVCVELPDDEEARHGSEREPEIDGPVVVRESELGIWASDRAGEAGPEDTIVQDLRKFAASGTVRERHTSSGERLYLGRLVDEYGDDLDRMARDRRLNPAQRTANELKRAIAKAGGFETLCTSTVASVPGLPSRALGTLIDSVTA